MSIQSNRFLRKPWTNWLKPSLLNLESSNIIDLSETSLSVSYSEPVNSTLQIESASKSASA